MYAKYSGDATGSLSKKMKLETTKGRGSACVVMTIPDSAGG